MANKEVDYDINYILIGDKFVGKTQLILRFVNDKFFDFYLPNQHSDFFKKKLKIDDKIIRLTIFDTLGDENCFPSPIEKIVACVIFVYDINDKESFENIPKYLEKSKKNHNNKLIFKVLVGNKSDDNENRQVEEEEGNKFATDNHMLFFEISVKC